MPQPGVFLRPSCRLPARKPRKPRKPQPCVSKGVQGCRLPALKPLNSKPSRRPVQGNHFRSYMPQPAVFYGVRGCRLPNPANPANPAAGLSKATTLAAHASSHAFLRAFKSCRLPALKPPNRPAGLSKATTFAATGPSQVFFTAFEAAVSPPSNPAKTSPQTFPRQQLSQHMPQTCVSNGVQNGGGRGHSGASPLFYLSCGIEQFILRGQQ